MTPNDWKAFAMEMWGIDIETWDPVPERAATLPWPLEYDMLQIGLIELGQEQRRAVLQGISCYQVLNFFLLSVDFSVNLSLDDLVGWEINVGGAY